MQAAGIACFAKTTGRLLLLRRSGEVTMPFVWSVPAGGVERGERLFDAALREFSEEAGYAGPMVVSRRPVFVEGSFSCFMAIASHQFRPRLNWENDDAGWFGPTLPVPLHAGVLSLLDHIEPW